MNGILRSVNTHFWDDNYIVELDPIEKLLFLYYLTNPLVNLLGIYEISLRRMSNDTGIDREMIQKLLTRFSESGKIFFHEGYIILPNHLKHQKLNTNMQKNIETSFENLPEEVKGFIFNKEDQYFESLSKAFKGFQRLRRVEVEDEVEDEVESEVESKNGKKSPQENLNHSKYLNGNKREPTAKIEKLPVTDLFNYLDENQYSDEEKRQRANLIYYELENSAVWREDLCRITHRPDDKTFAMVKEFLIELKARNDYFKPLSEIKKHCVSWIKKNYVTTPSKV